MKKYNKEKQDFRVAFRTKSKLEIMDDGYKWRKYGKKRVKSSPNPRYVHILIFPISYMKSFSIYSLLYDRSKFSILLPYLSDLIDTIILHVHVFETNY